MKTKQSIAGTAILLGLGVILFSPNFAMAHCDGLDGPVVKAAQEALASRDVNHVLIWVQKDDEREIRGAFERTLSVRELSAEARELADRYFFETLVRIHRAGEGAPYTGLKPAGRDFGPAIPIADQSLTTGKVDPLVEFINNEIRRGLTERFDDAVRAKNYAPTDVAAGREYVQAYVTLIHYVERAYEAASQLVARRFSDGQHPVKKHEK